VLATPAELATSKEIKALNSQTYSNRAFDTQRLFGGFANLTRETGA
jgi:hypothetical protein